MSGKMRPYSAVILDMDGLVVDTEGSYFSAWCVAAKKMGYDLDDVFLLSLSGLHYQAVEAKLLEYCGQQFNLSMFAQLSGDIWRERVERHGIAVKKGVIELLDFLNADAIPYCLATNSRSLNVLEVLGFAGLTDRFRLRVTRDDVSQGKPSPEIFVKAAELMRQPLENCLILEDSATGVIAAEQTPAQTILIPSVPITDLSVIEKADCVFDDLFFFLENFTQLYHCADISRASY